jgi:hypothetical protein
VLKFKSRPTPGLRRHITDERRVLAKIIKRVNVELNNVLISQCFPLESAEVINRYMHTYWSFIDISLAVSFALVLFDFIRNRNR